jgi:hypothetical protein
MRHLVASVIFMAALTGCVPKIEPATITPHDYSVCVSGFVGKSTIDELAIEHCAKHNRVIRDLGAEQGLICGIARGQQDITPVYFAYKCVDKD